MDRNMLLYRGSLKSCNYRCSYCPFSKHPMSERELHRDKAQWNDFVYSYQKKAKALRLGALMVVPYGEAMVHPWYWEGLAQLSRLPETEAVGAQTNLSFSVQKFLDVYKRAGGIQSKLRLWATFHPEMTSVSAFADKCKSLWEAGILLCAGSVGVPENLALLSQCRRELPDEIYLWINKMDGLRRAYTQEEREAFLRIDPYFERELTLVSADCSKCNGRLFVEADGRLRVCNISPLLKERWEELDRAPALKCQRSWCSCYLAYGGREDNLNRVLFGKYPLFRIPRRPKAVFLNMENIPVTAQVMAGLNALVRERAALFFAVSLPYQDARRRYEKIWHLFMGGIFAGGAHIWAEIYGCGERYGQDREHICDMEDGRLFELAPLEREFRFRMLIYRKNKKLYKVTLLRPCHKPWSEQEAETLIKRLSVHSDAVRYYIEENCLQIVSAKADKKNSIRLICQWLGISPEDTVVAED